MDQQAGSPDPNADTCAPAEHLRPVPSNGPAAPPQKKKRPGPKTPQGKARSSRNPTRFGIHSADPVIPGIENLEEWRVHREGVIASLAPVGSLETKLAERVALLLWRLNRVRPSTPGPTRDTKISACRPGTSWTRSCATRPT